MKILLVNKFLYRRAGAEAYVLDLGVMLERAGHEVAYFGMNDSRNIKTPWTKYFVNEIHYDRSDGLLRDIRKLGHMIWSTEAAKKFRMLLADFKPDVVHIHNIYHHLSPSIIAVANRAGVPVVQTLHDYKLICPSYRLFCGDEVDESCKRYRYWNEVRHRCLNGSLAASAAVAIESWIHRALGIYERGVTRFITPSEFLRDLLGRWGKDLKKIVVIRNPIEVKPELNSENLGVELRDGVIFAGRLATEKGIVQLLQAAEKLPEIPFAIAGDGPLREDVEKKIQKMKNVELAGFLKSDELARRISSARMVAVPSIWYENYPYSVLEAMALGKVVVASSTGGVPEMIEDGKTGMLVPAGDVPALVDTIKKMYQNTELLERMGSAAREKVSRENRPQDHLTAILEMYQQVISPSS